VTGVTRRDDALAQMSSGKKLGVVDGLNRREDIGGRIVNAV
jgi:hypothetical protein